ncbi:hypothetical protein SCANM63S_07860 [Streptomyces canarius]
MNAYDGATAAVVGGSIGGLTTALLLRDLGFSVDVFERTPTALDGRGSGIVLQPDTLRWFTERSEQHPQDLSTSTEWVQYLGTGNDVVYRERTTWSYTSWGTFYRALLADFGTDHYHLGEYACGFDQDEQHATVRFVSGREVTADLVVFADGITSTARQRFDPAAALTYSGYIGWRGTVPEKDLSDDTRELLRNAITYTVVPHSHITLYPIPGEGEPARGTGSSTTSGTATCPRGPSCPRCSSTSGASRVPSRSIRRRSRTGTSTRCGSPRRGCSPPRRRRW